VRHLNLLPTTARFLAVFLVVTTASSAVICQETGKPPSQSEGQNEDSSVHNLQKQMLELKSMLEEMRNEILRSRKEAIELRQELEATRQELSSSAQPRRPANRGEEGQAEGNAQAPLNHSTEQTIKTLVEDQQLTAAKVEELHQTKVESGSKYPVRLSGLVLLNLLSNKGTTDNLDFPSLALFASSGNSGGSFGGSLRQSLLGLEVFGPDLRGAKVNADLQFDFAGGFPYAPDGVTFGLLRLRTGVLRVAWPNTTVVAGQDAPFFSPLSPSSIASLAVPAFSYAGNLWNWTPQVRVEHRFNVTENSGFILQGGILDPLTGDLPTAQFLRMPQAGEASRQPAYAARIAWSHHVFGHDLILGIGSYYSRQNWGFQRMVDGWAGTADWTLPLSFRWELSGEFYRGRSIGGLGGGIGRSALFNGPITDPATQVHGLNSIGGWSQLKFRQTEKFEWNASFGQDNALARDLSYFLSPVSQQGYFAASLARNRSALLNFIYHPRSNLLFSTEYRRLQTFSVTGTRATAEQISLNTGVLF